jgi:hypothetical protein
VGKTEVRRPKTEDGRQKLEGRRMKTGAESWFVTFGRVGRSTYAKASVDKSDGRRRWLAKAHEGNRKESRRDGTGVTPTVALYMIGRVP